MDLSNPQTIQNILILIILIFGIISIVLNWRASPIVRESPVSPTDEVWERLLREAEHARARKEEECERVTNDLLTKLAAKTAESEALRVLVDRLTLGHRDGLNVNVQQNERQGGIDIDKSNIKVANDMIGNNKTN